MIGTILVIIGCFIMAVLLIAQVALELSPRAHGKSKRFPVAVVPRRRENFTQRVARDIEENPQDWTVEGLTYTHKSGRYVVVDREGEKPQLIKPAGWSTVESRSLNTAVIRWRIWEADQHFGVDTDLSAAVKEVAIAVGEVINTTTFRPSGSRLVEVRRTKC